MTEVLLCFPQSVQANPRIVRFALKQAMMVQRYSFVNLGDRWGGASTPRSGRFYSGKLPGRLGGLQDQSGRVRIVSTPNRNQNPKIVSLS